MTSLRTVLARVPWLTSSAFAARYRAPIFRALHASSKHIAVHNGPTEVRPDVYEDAKLIGVIRRGRRPDVSIFRMA